MAKGEIKEKLEELYPTAEDMLVDRRNHTSWKALAKAIKVSEHNLLDHRRRLGMPREPKKGNVAPNFNNKTSAQIDESIKAMGESELKPTNVFRRYKIVEPDKFYANTLGYDGLELIGEEQGETWRSVQYQKYSEREALVNESVHTENY